MDLFIESLSSNQQPDSKYTIQSAAREDIVSYRNNPLPNVLSSTVETFGGDFTLDGKLTTIPFTIQEQQFHSNPVLIADKNRALQTIQEILSATNELKQQLQTTLFDRPVCPYQQTLLEYLGPNFICPTINDLTLPLNFSSTESISSITKIDNKYNDQLMTQLKTMTAEAADMSFAGITSVNLGNAFAVLSTTSTGQEYVIDKQHLAQYLEFAELIRNIPDEEIINNTNSVALKLINRFIEIHQ